MTLIIAIKTAYGVWGASYNEQSLVLVSDLFDLC